jgi:predicted CxxxxCH...CXXCH cytochrome family protein
MRSPHAASLAALAIAGALASSCREERATRGAPPTWRDGVGSILQAKCVRCHAGPEAAGGFRADTYLGAIGCTASGASAIGGASPPLVAVLDRADHAGIVDETERDVLSRWVAAGAPSFRAGTHASSFADPRSKDSHGRFLRSKRWRPLLDGSDPDACAKCHEGAGSRPPGLEPAPGATPCSTCHTQPEGILACSTCHGSAPKAYPPRDACFFPDEPRTATHARHVDPSASSVGLPCSTCHPQPLPGQLGGTHGNGHLEVWLDWSVAGNAARWDEKTKECAETCHARGGARPTPRWGEAGPLGCNDCHASPPPKHYAGACSNCHREANETGTALTAPKLHVNGKVDLGDGSGTCGACHGQGESPWPATGAHLLHAQPKGAAPVACETCHDLPAHGERHPVGRERAAVRLLGVAAAGGARPTYDPPTKTCAATWCHNGAGGSVPAPKWTDKGAPAQCGSCHATPPPLPHSQGQTCSTTTCHEGATTDGPFGPELTPKGKAVHVNGRIDRVVQ